MSTIVSLNSISQRAGHKQLFEGLNLVISRETRLGIVGPNGSGKSTLMALIAGKNSPDEGRVVTERDLRIAYVPQVEKFEEQRTVKEVVVAALQNLAVGREVYEHEIDVRAEQIIKRMNFQDPQQKVALLSGGWRKRLSLAVALAQEPDLMLLDEPTNHLDLAGLLWLENFLKEASFAWILISHDRYFLEHTVSEVLEIAPYYEKGYFRTNGSYGDFVEKRQNFLEQEAQRISALANKVKTELAWAARMPKARTTKAGYRLREASRLESELKERMSRTVQSGPEVAFTSSARQTRELVKLISVSFGFGERELIQKENLTITNGMCLGVLGKNGQGKSTLLKLIGGELSPTAGKVKQADRLRVVYFDQLRKSISPELTVWYALGEGKDSVPYQGNFVHIIGWAKRFGFEPDELQKPVSQLSGGQQARILLAKLATQEADLLILDEPTNDLDIPMLEALEAMLIDFEGASILVTHDRYMLTKVCSHYVGFTDAQRLLAFSSYEQWESTNAALAQNSVAKTSVANSSNSKSASGESKSLDKPKQSYQQRKECEQVERKIAKVEERLGEIEQRAADPNNHQDLVASQKLAQELAETKSELDQLYARWETLAG